MSRRVVEGAPSGPTLEWHSLPVVGADRRRPRRSRRRVMIACAAIWLALIALWVIG